MKIAILGGRFDPPHIGHWLIAKQALEQRPEIDEIWFMPAFKHQWKEILTSVKDRMIMLGFMKNNRIKISDIEIKREGISYSIDTIKEIKKKYKHQIYWIIGSDILSEFNRWNKKEELTKLTTFLVFPRDPYAIPKNLPKGFEVLKGKNLIVTNLSSTLIRQRIKKHLPISNLVPKGVEEYIKKHELYK
ncbi:MAG: nicotinate (nicotinamide) nucleotide adenylyltransferase [Candidatus Levyibacteriota bacterium]